VDDQELKDVLDRAAAAVSHLPSSLQPAAFAEAVRLLAAESTTKDTGPTRSTQVTPRRTRDRKPSTKKSRARKLAPSLDRSLDLHPNGRASLNEFHKEKAPKSQDEHNVVFVHYLKNIANVEAVTVDQIYTSYREVNARIPSNLRNSLALTSAKKGWIDSSDMENLSVTPRGENVVNIELPHSAKD
jgi:hypothetical protein